MKKACVLLLGILLLTSFAFAESGDLAAELGLNAEAKPASSYTAEINSAVYSLLDFENTSEYDKPSAV